MLIIGILLHTINTHAESHKHSDTLKSQTHNGLLFTNMHTQTTLFIVESRPHLNCVASPKGGGSTGYSRSEDYCDKEQLTTCISTTRSSYHVT